MADALPVETITGIPLMSVGGPFRGIGSPPEGDFYTEADLKQMADDTMAVIDEVDPFTKIGHNSAQILARRSGLYADDQPNTGSWRNFRVEGGKLLADVEGIPAKLASLFKSRAFSKRSVEFKPYESQKGKGKFDRVIRAVALLGAKAPAIKTLDDVTALYGDDENDDADLHVVYYEDDDPAAGTGTLDLRIDLATDSTPPADTTSEMADTPETKGLSLDEEQAKTLAETLGVKEGEVTVDALLAAAGEVRKNADKAEADPPTPPPDPAPAPDPTPPPPSESVEVPVGTHMMSEAEYLDLRARADAGAHAAQALFETRRDAAIKDAVEDGRIDPAKADEFTRLYEDDEETAVKVLSLLSPNEQLAREYGTSDDREPTEDEQRLYEEFNELSGVESLTTAKGD